MACSLNLTKPMSMQLGTLMHQKLGNSGPVYLTKGKKEAALFQLQKNAFGRHLQLNALVILRERLSKNGPSFAQT